MSRRKTAAASISILLILAISAPAADDVRVRKIPNGNLPKPAAVALASGSGVIVGKRFVLTNRHIAQDDKNKLFDGFRVYISPDYKKPVPAKVVAICESHDLALLQTSADLPYSGVSLLDGLPPLSNPVVAYGFPLGSRFGVGLTTTGGQISRHPVAIDRGDDEEDASVKRALWHDAVLTSGNSGGPLFTSSKVLVGINFAYLTTSSKNALAVPGNVVTEFLKKGGASDGVTLVKSVDEGANASDPQALTVFIESMVEDVSSRGVDLSGASSIGDMIIANLRTKLPALTPSALKRMEAGELVFGFQPTKAADIKAGEIVRVKGQMTIEVLVGEESMMTTIDGARCFVVLAPGESDEVRTRLAKDPNPTAPVDAVYFVGPPATIRTPRGSIFAIVLLPLRTFAESSDYKKLIAEEKARRDAGKAVNTESQDPGAIERYLAKLQRTFTDNTGQYKTDAAVVTYDTRSVRLIRMSDKQKVSVPTEKLSREDRVWLLENESSIKLYGSRLEQHFDAEQRAQTTSAAAGGGK